MDSLIIFYSFYDEINIIANIMSSSLNIEIDELREVSKSLKVIKKLRSRLNLKSYILPLSQLIMSRKNIILIIPLFKKCIIPSAVISFIKQYDLSDKNLSFILCCKETAKGSDDIFHNKIKQLGINCNNIINFNINKNTMVALQNSEIEFKISSDNILYLSDPKNINNL